jgi:glycerophosphoryl diester phosphodiesterase
MARPLLLGHRGARKYAPENTMAAFEQALADGCDGFEFDVRLTADRQAVVVHDPKFCGVPVASVPYDRLCEAGSRKNEEISRLEDVLKLGERAFLNVELKVAGAEEAVIELLKSHPARRGLVVSSFLPEVLVRLHELEAEFELGLICENRRQLARWKDLPVSAVMAERGLVDQRLTDEIRKTPLKPKEGLKGAPELKIFVWTVNSAREMRKFVERGVDGIISDDTKLLARTVGSIVR